jgi:nitrous oxidase accessory protein NosD
MVRVPSLRPFLRLAAIPAALVLAGAMATPAHADASATSSRTVYVSTRGADGPLCGRAINPCRTIERGVMNASFGARVLVFPGTYHEAVDVSRRVSLQGLAATIDATGADHGINVHGAAASGSTVRGFTIMNAIGEGIILTSVDGVTVVGNHVTMNDKGEHTAVYPPCADSGAVPGDCGEAVHLQGTTGSQILFNRVDHNVGGILVTDESGPTRGNLIKGNRVMDNLEDCGITMPSHVPGLGVTNNVVTDNYVARNGGAGVLLATPAPGMAVTGNLVSHNVIFDNGEGGIQLHAHAPSQSVDDNTLDGNIIGRNNMAGDTDSGDLQTTGIIVFSAVVPVHGLVVRHNVITNNAIGIWLSPQVDTTGIAQNVFGNVDTPVFQ